MELNDILTVAVKAKGSDVHIKAGLPPIVRIDGRLRPIPNAPRMSADAIREMAYTMMNEKQRQHFEEFFEVDLSYGIPGSEPFPRQRILPARLRGHGVPCHRLRRSRLREPESAAGAGEV